MATSAVGFTQFPQLAALEKSKVVEYDTPVQGHVEVGQLPQWLQGSWYRNGPGMIHFREQSVSHWFDGMALPRRFEINDGRVFYRSRFIRGQSYHRNIAAGRVVVPEFGTHVQSKPKTGLLSKAANMMSIPEFTDNCLISFLHIGEYLFAISETNLIRRIDPVTLETMENIDLSKHVPVNLMSSTPLVDLEGNTYNFTTSLFSMGRTKYNFIKIPKPQPGTPASKALGNAKCVASIDSAWRLSPSYHHSFVMTNKYAIFTEQPLKLSIPKIAVSHWSNMNYSDCLEYHSELKTIFHIIDKETDNSLSTTYITDPFVVYQHINAYEKDNHVVIDLSCFDKHVFFQKYIMENLQMSIDDYMQKFDMKENHVQVKRFVLPLNVSKKIPETENLVLLTGTTCTAFRKKNNSISLTGEVLFVGTDYPAINPRFVGKPYKYYYTTGGKVLPPGEKLMKANVVDKKIIHTWQHNDCWASRPEFVPRPNSIEEDDGLILSSVWCKDDKPFLLVLDGKTFGETRITFDANIPPDLHGVFIPKKEKREGVNE